MSHLAWVPRGTTHRIDCDVVVVGSGAGGATAAARLAERGLHVVVVEAGAWRDPPHYPASAYGAMRDLMEDWGAQFTRGPAFWPIVQGRAVGGTTVINSAIAVHTPDDIYDLWAREHGLKSARFVSAMRRYQRELDDELRVGVARPEVHGQNGALARRAADALGIEHHDMRRYVDDCAGSGQCMQGCRENRKQSLNITFIPRVLEQGGSVLSNAPVARVRFRGQRAIGVYGRFRDPRGRRGGRFQIDAARGVVIAASATRSPVLLRRSGVRHPALGRFFRAHPGTGVFGLYDQVVDMNRGPTQGWASVHFRDTPHAFKLETLAIPPEMVVSRIKGGGRTYMERLADYRHLTMWVLGLRAQHSVGTVRAGLFGKPVVRYTLCPADMASLRAGMVQLAKLQFAAGAKAVLPGIHGLPHAIGPDELGLLEEAPLDPRAYTAILSHLFGGCVMGADPRRSVCDLRGRVRGHHDLYVADASLIPTVLGVNPQHTIMGLARWVADHIAG